MNEKRLSIIIPIYNVELYVERCLRSIEAQDIPFSDYEVICINDGSPDNSREVVIKLKKEFENIVLLDQSNQGVSLARNRGLSVATGRYILFVDPDDYVDPNSFGLILENAEQSQTQILFLGFTTLFEDGKVKYKYFNERLTNKLYHGHEAYHLSRGDGSIDPDRTWGILFDMNFLKRNSLNYLPGVPYLEDGEFIARVLCLADRCQFYGNSFYQRTARPGSATNSKLFYTSKAVNGFFLAAKNLKEFQLNPSLNEAQVNFLNQPICKFTILVVDSLSQSFSISRLRDAVRRLKEIEVGRLDLQGLDKEFFRLGYIYNISIYLLVIHIVSVHLIISIRTQLMKTRRL